MALAGDTSILMLRLPTWYVNPTISMEYLQSEDTKDPLSFQAEYGAEFILTASPYISHLVRESFESCFDAQCPEIGTNYMGVDLGLVNDATGIGITSRFNDKVNVIYAEELRPDDTPLDADAVVERIVRLAGAYKVKSIRIDQHGGQQLLQALNKRGLRKVTIASPGGENYTIYKHFEYRYRSGNLKIIDDTLIKERFYGLTRRPQANHTFRVESSADDLPDAIARAVYEADNDPTYVAASPYVDFAKMNKAITRYQERMKRKAYTDMLRHGRRG